MLVATLLTLTATIVTAQDVWYPNVHTLDPTPATEIKPEMIGMTSLWGRQHPEFGIPVANMPPNTFELIDKRTQFSRTFVENGTLGTHIYVQTGLQPLHYMHLGRWLSYDNRLEQIAYGVYASKSMPQKTVINTEMQSITIERNGPGDVFRFGQLQLKHVSATGIETPLGFADWTHVTSGNNGTYVTDAWNNIDLEIIFPPGAVTLAECKTNIILKGPLPFSDGELVIVDEIEFTDMSVSSIESTVVFQSTTETEKEITFHPIIVVDNSGNRNAFTIGSYDFDITPTGASLSMSVPLSWLQAPERVYPIVIDPLVTSTAALAAGSKDSGYGGSYCIGGNAANNCTYVLSAALPPETTVVGGTFNMVTQSNTTAACGSCYMNEQGLQIKTACGISPSAVLFWTCLAAAPGTCTGTGLDMDALVTCFTPTCDSIIQFILETSYCYCSNNGTDCMLPLPCQRVNSLSVIIEGYTVEAMGATYTIGCYENQTLDPAAQYGVPGYTYAWSTGETTPTIVFNAGGVAGTFTRTCTVTDACGISVTATFTINTICGLPIDITEYSGNWNGSNANLWWTTATEDNNNYFIVERSYDGQNFSKIGKVDGRGTTTIPQDYDFVDYDPRIGTNYYRLLQIDFDESIDTIGTIAIEVTSPIDMKVWPNPAENTLNVSVATPGEFWIEILDVYGRRVTEPVPVKTTNTLDVSFLERGIYMVCVVSTERRQLVKFIKE